MAAMTVYLRIYFCSAFLKLLKQRRFMKKRLLALHLMMLIAYCSFSQSIGIGTVSPDGSAALDITHANKGLLIPRMGTAAINIIPNPAKGLLVYDSVIHQLMVNVGTPASPNWQSLSSKNVWNLGGNNATNPATQFVGTSDNQPLRFRINNTRAGELHPATGNIFWGLRAGMNTTGFSNVGMGTDALKLNTVRSNLVAIGDSALFNNGVGVTSTVEGAANTAIGSKTLFANTIGSHNTAAGYKSLHFNTTGGVNTAFGSSTLYNNTTGRFNVAVGTSSLYHNTSAEANTAIGYLSLHYNTGSNNTAAGFESLAYNTTGTNNVAMGLQALVSNSTGSANTAVGLQALYANTTAQWNTGVGTQALWRTTTGASNVATGAFALSNNVTGSGNVAIGQSALSWATASEFNTAVGYQAGAGANVGWNNTFIGAQSQAIFDGTFNSTTLGQGAIVTASNQVRFGNSSTSSIGGMVGYSNLSDGRYKKNIHEDVKGIDFIMKLRPVTYQIDLAGINARSASKDHASAKTENETTIFSGFVAQEVEQAAKDAGYDFSGVDKPKNANDLYGLRYSEFVVPLVKAMQEQQRMIEELKKQNAELEKRIKALENK